MAIVDQEVDPRSIEATGSGGVGATKHPWFRGRMVWDLIPVVVSLAWSSAFIIRSVVFIGGKRYYVLFDDAAISLTYARNLAHGNGLVWMVGQPHVEGYSNFLWTLWMAAIEWIGPSDRMAGLWVMISSALLLAGNTYLVCRITRRLAPGSRVAPPMAGLVVALYYGLTSWSLEGMETGLVAILYTGAVLCALRLCDSKSDRSVRAKMLAGTAVLLSLAVLTRDDAFIMTIVVAIFVWRSAERHLRHALIVVGPVLAVMALHIALRLAYYGQPFPNTFYLKTQGVPLATRLGRGWVVVAQNTSMQLVVAVLLAAAYFVLARRNNGRLTTGTGMLAGAVIAQAAYVVYVGGDSYDVTLSDRYLCVMVPFLFILAVLGAVQLAELGASAGTPMVMVGLVVIAAGFFTAWAVLPVSRLQILTPSHWHVSSWAIVLWVTGGAFVGIGLLRWHFRLRAAGIAVAVLVVGILVTTNGVQAQSWFGSNYFGQNTDVLVVILGLRLASATMPDTSIAVTGAGNVAFFDHRPAIDLFGYSDHRIATSKPHSTVYLPGRGWIPLPFQPGHDKWDYDYSIGTLRPDVVVNLAFPTPAELAHMTTWGYLQTSGGIFYLPGKLDPTKI